MWCTQLSPINSDEEWSRDWLQGWCVYGGVIHEEEMGDLGGLLTPYFIMTPWSPIFIFRVLFPW